MSEPKFKMASDEYAILYPHLVEKTPRELLAFAIPIDKKMVLELCCGVNGNGIKEAVEMGAYSVTGVDTNPHIYEIPQKIGFNKRGFNKDGNLLSCSNDYDREVLLFNGSTHSFLKYYAYADTYDAVICQQGINYWFDKDNLLLLKRSMTKNSKFVFSTFPETPSEKPVTRTFKANGKEYVEIHCLDANGFIHRSVYVEGHEPHHTSFLWIPEERLEVVLREVFSDVVNMNITVGEESSLIYICKK